MKKAVIITALLLSMSNLTGCELKRASQENNITGKLTTTVFDDRNSFEDLEINEKIGDEVKVKDGDTSKKDYNLWKKIRTHLVNLRWR